VRIIEPVEVSATKLTAIEAATMRAMLAHTQTKPTVAGYLATLRRKLGEVKVKPALEIARRAILDGHEKVVLWTWHNDIGAALVQSACDLRTFRLSADMPAAAREQEVTDFRTYQGPACMVASMGVAGVGLDLSCSDYAIFVELDWTPANVCQAEMRTFHMRRPHCLVFLYADTSVEARLVEALNIKNGFAGAVGLGQTDIEIAVLNGGPK
jgi:hypothetical protein